MLNKVSNIIISPSIIAADLTTLGTAIQYFDATIIDMLHIDVMDGNFVPNLTIGPGYIKNLMEHTIIPFDIHLMIANPDIAIHQYIELRPKYLTFHYESTRFPFRLLNVIKNAGIGVGISINPATPTDHIINLLPYVDLILIMSVEPGFYGQKFLHFALSKIKDLYNAIHRISHEHHPLIQVDGGISEENIALVVKAGAQIIVAGNSAFSGGDVNENVKRLKKAASSS